MFDISEFIKDDAAPEPEPQKRKRGRPKKSESRTVANVKIEEPVPTTSISYVQSNIPYINAYEETNRQLDAAIMQLDALNAEVVAQFATVKNSKTLKNKYNYINEYSQTISSIIGNKITAIKEKNKTINDVNNMELKRLKDLKNNASEEDDNMRIANMYDAFINTPVGVNRPSLGPSMANVTMQAGTGMNTYNSSITVAPGDDQAMWESTLDPVQNRMLLEAKGLIETVVFYDESSGNRWFEVLDKNTRNPMPNVEKPTDAHIYDLDINIRGGYAKDPNINKSYPLIVVNNSDQSISKF